MSRAAVQLSVQAYRRRSRLSFDNLSDSSSSFLDWEAPPLHHVAMPSPTDSAHRASASPFASRFASSCGGRPAANEDRRDHFYANPVPAWLVDRLGNVIASNAAARRVVAPAHTGLSLAMVLHSDADSELLFSQLQCCALGLSLLQVPVTVRGASGLLLSGDLSFAAPGDGRSPPWWEVQFIDRSAEIDSQKVLEALLISMTTGAAATTLLPQSGAALQSVLVQAAAMAAPALARLSVRVDFTPAPPLALDSCGAAAPQLVRDLLLHVGQRCAPQGCVRMRAESTADGAVIRIGAVPLHGTLARVKGVDADRLSLDESLLAEQRMATSLGGRLSRCSSPDLVDGLALRLPSRRASARP